MGPSMIFAPVKIRGPTSAPLAVASRNAIPVESGLSNPTARYADGRDAKRQEHPQRLVFRPNPWMDMHVDEPGQDEHSGGVDDFG